MDYSGADAATRVRIRCDLAVYLAEKFGAFLPKDRGKRTEALNWLFWQMGSTPYVGGGFGHLTPRSGEDQIRHRPFYKRR